MPEAIETTFNVADLLDRIGGRATEGELQANFDDIHADHFRAWGAEVATPRIHTSGVRIVGDAVTFMTGATEVQLDALSTSRRSLCA